MGCSAGFGSGCGSGQQFRDADQVVGGDGEGEDSVHAGFAADFDGCEACRRLDPAEDLLDAFAAALADGLYQRPLFLTRRGFPERSNSDSLVPMAGRIEWQSRLRGGN